MRAFREHSNQTLHSNHLIFHVLFLFKHLSHTTVNDIGDFTAKRKRSFTQVMADKPAKRAKLDILPIGKVGLGESKHV